jgi:GT2 family glycosyltransferase
VSGISVVICAYTEERLALLVEAIDSVERQRLPALETIVVVDSNPALEAEVRARRPHVRVVANQGPTGLSGARNTGVGAAAGDRVAFLDDDASADAAWLEHLDAGMADPGVMVAGGSVLPDFAAGRPGWFPREFDWVFGCSYHGQAGWDDTPDAERPVLAVRNVIGASMLIRRSALEDVGGFRTDLGRIGTVPVGGEETEFCIRVGARYGWGSVVLASRARVDHHVPASRTSFRYFVRRCRAEGLTKAALSRVASRRTGLSSEMRYLFRTLPVAFMRALEGAVLGDGASARRAGAIAVGATETGFAWLHATFRRRRDGRDVRPPGDPPRIDGPVPATTSEP